MFFKKHLHPDVPGIPDAHVKRAVRINGYRHAPDPRILGEVPVQEDPYAALQFRQVQDIPFQADGRTGPVLSDRVLGCRTVGEIPKCLCMELRDALQSPEGQRLRPGAVPPQRTFCIFPVGSLSPEPSYRFRKVHEAVCDPKGIRLFQIRVLFLQFEAFRLATFGILSPDVYPAASRCL